MSPHDGSRQKLRNCVYICLSYAEKTVASFFPGHGVYRAHRARAVIFAIAQLSCSFYRQRTHQTTFI